MKIKPLKRALFLPLNDLILSSYDGYVNNGKPISPKQLRRLDKLEKIDKWLKKHRFIFFIIKIILLIIIFLPYSLSWLLEQAFQTKKENSISTRIREWTKNILYSNYFLNYRKKIEAFYNGNLDTENISEIFNRCLERNVKVIIYSFNPLSVNQQNAVQKLITDKRIDKLLQLNDWSGLSEVIDADRISVMNSFIVVYNPQQVLELEDLGFLSSDADSPRNIFLYSFSLHNDFRNTTCYNPLRKFSDLIRHIIPYIYVASKSFLNKNLILFLEDEFDPILNQYIAENLKRINQNLAKKELSLIYFPALKKSLTENNRETIELIKKRIPTFSDFDDNKLSSIFIDLISMMRPEDFYDFMRKELQLASVQQPCFLRNVPEYSSPSEYNKFTHFPIKYTDLSDLEKNIEFYLGVVKIPVLDSNVYYQLAKKEDVDDSEDFSIGISQNLKLTIDQLKAAGEHSALAEAVIYMLQQMKEDRPDLINQLKPILEKNLILNAPVVLSPIFINHHFKIILMGTKHIEVKMHPLPKTLFLFYLRHPEGVRFKELYLYKDELSYIYNKVTNKYEKLEIQQAIDDLVDMSNPSINQKSSRIKEAFRKIMDDETAAYYYLQGNPGEPRKILLHQDLISFHPDLDL